MLCDLHVHTRHSYDSHVLMSAYCDRAIKRGVTHICFTDHIDMDPRDSGHGQYNLDAYFEDLHRVRNEYADRLTVFAGLEFAEPHIYRALFERVKRYPFDFILGSLHWVRGHYPAMYVRSRWTEEQAYAYYWEEMAHMVEAGGFDAVSHFDLPKRYLKRTIYNPDSMCRILETIVRNGLILEVNTSSLRAGADEPMPGMDVLKMYLEAGGLYVTTGSDAHTLADLGADIVKIRQRLHDAGLHTGYFENRTFIEENSQ